VFVNVHADGDLAREGAAQTMGGSYNQDFRDMVDNVAAAGTPQEVTDKLVAFVEAGARHFIFMPAPGPDGDADAIIHRLLDDVVPRVRERTA
jgi:alkanesulfonate monooxygenase SsuD/methylene tetrahydromethanopterin reductase-like flavin-dependent oxidoreductase (luciferase family)